MNSVDKNKNGNSRLLERLIIVLTIPEKNPYEIATTK